MEKEIYKHPSNNWKAAGIVIWQILFTALALYISYIGTGFVWFLGQVLLAISLFQWFVLHHDFVHDSLFKTRWLNRLFGHISAITTLMPYYTFKFSHHQHHIWTGWRDKDPTSPQSYMKEPPAWAIKIVNFCWRFWIPLISPVFVVQNFWDLKRLFATLPSKKDRRRMIFSVCWVVLVYAALIILLPAFLLQNWLLAFLLFLVVSDVVLMSQHTHIEGHFSEDKEVKAFKFSEQARYSRTIIYPKFLARFFFYNFDKHGLHHQQPAVPSYHLGKLPLPYELKVHWWDWIKTAKSLSAYELIYASPAKKKTG